MQKILLGRAVGFTQVKLPHADKHGDIEGLFLNLPGTTCGPVARALVDTATGTTAVRAHCCYDYESPVASMHFPKR